MAEKKKEEEKLYSEAPVEEVVSSNPNYSGNAPLPAAPLAPVAPASAPPVAPARPNPVVKPATPVVQAPASTLGQFTPENAQISQAYDQLNQAAQPDNIYPPGLQPREATARSLNNLQRQQELEHEEGGERAQELAMIADKNAEAANEKQQQAKDFQDFQAANQAKYQAAHDQTQQAYQTYRQAAGNLKDPSSQFWEDKEVGARIVSALAAFSSGMGAGLLGHAGNPFLDYLNKQIEGNYQAHKQNVEDLYNAAVASGKIEDNVESHNRFLNEAKLKSYDLASAHITSELQAIQNSSASQVSKITAAKAITGLEQQGIQMRAQLAQQEAAKQATALSQDRAKQKEARDYYQTQLKFYGSSEGGGLSPDEAAQRAARDTGQFFPGGNIGGKLDQIGIEAGKRAAATPQNAGSQPTIDSSGNVVAPTVGDNGRRLTPEQQKDILSKTLLVNGQPRVAVNEEAAKEYKEYQNARGVIDQARKQLQDYQNANSVMGDRTQWLAARGAIIDALPGLLLGSKASGPREAQIKETYGDIVPNYYTTENKNEALASLDELIKAREESLTAATFGGYKKQQDTKETIKETGLVKRK